MAAEITSEELWNLPRTTSAPSAVLFHNSDSDISWWKNLSTRNDVDLYTFPVAKLFSLFDLKLHKLKKTPAIKLFHRRTANVLNNVNASNAANWIDLHLDNVSMLSEDLVPFFANENSAVLVAQTNPTCDAFKNATDHDIKYACFLQGELLPECDIVLFGKYTDASCIKSVDEAYNMTTIYSQLKKHVFPTLLNADMMNDPLLLKLRPFSQTVFVIADTPPHVSNISNNVHVVWERTESQMFGVRSPTVIRQDFWAWYGHELVTDEAVNYAVYDALKAGTPLDISKVFTAMQMKNFSLVFDPTWDKRQALRSMMPKRPPLPKFNFTKPTLGPKANLTLSIEEDKKMARKMGIDTDKL